MYTEGKIKKLEKVNKNKRPTTKVSSNHPISESAWGPREHGLEETDLRHFRAGACGLFPPGPGTQLTGRQPQGPYMPCPPFSGTGLVFRAPTPPETRTAFLCTASQDAQTSESASLHTEAAS